MYFFSKNHRATVESAVHKSVLKSVHCWFAALFLLSWLLIHSQVAQSQEAVSTVCNPAATQTRAYWEKGRKPAYRLNEFIISTPYRVMEAGRRMKINGDPAIKAKGREYLEQNIDLETAAKSHKHKNEFVVVRPPYATDLYHTCGWKALYPIEGEYALSTDQPPIIVRGNMCDEVPEIAVFQAPRSFDTFVAGLYEDALIGGEPLSYFSLADKSRSTFSDPYSLITAIMNVRAAQCGDQPLKYKITVEKENLSPTAPDISTALVPIYEADLLIGAEGIFLIPRDDLEARRIARLTNSAIERLARVNDWESRLNAGAPGLMVFLFTLGASRVITRCENGEQPVNGQC